MNLLSTQAAAEKLGVSERRVRSLITEGKLIAHRMGRDYAIEETALSAVVIHGKRGRPAKAKPDDEAVDLAAINHGVEAEAQSADTTPKPKRTKIKNATATKSKPKRGGKKAKSSV